MLMFFWKICRINITTCRNDMFRYSIFCTFWMHLLYFFCMIMKLHCKSDRNRTFEQSHLIACNLTGRWAMITYFRITTSSLAASPSRFSSPVCHQRDCGLPVLRVYWLTVGRRGLGCEPVGAEGVLRGMKADRMQLRLSGPHPSILPAMRRALWREAVWRVRYVGLAEQHSSLDPRYVMHRMLLHGWE